jgi:hypothetical protein
MLLSSADFTENSYDYTASVWNYPVKPVEQEEKAMKKTAWHPDCFLHSCARIVQGSPQSHLALWGEEAQRNG